MILIIFLRKQKKCLHFGTRQNSALTTTHIFQEIYETYTKQRLKKNILIYNNQCLILDSTIKSHGRNLSRDKSTSLKTYSNKEMKMKMMGNKNRNRNRNRNSNRTQYIKALIRTSRCLVGIGVQGVLKPFDSLLFSLCLVLRIMLFFSIDYYNNPHHHNLFLPRS